VRALLVLGLTLMSPSLRPVSAAPARWLRVLIAFPPTPTSIDQLPGKGAYGFLDQLVLKLAGVSTKKTATILGAKTTVGRCRTTKERVRQGTRISEGSCGTRAVGYRWEEQTSLESSSVAVAVRATLYGVAGARLEWLFALESVGQAGPSAFRHRSLRVQLAPARQAHFVAVWQSYFGTTPTLAPFTQPPRHKER
jgi:hypothetical protein